jgi:hypothetical protein
MEVVVIGSCRELAAESSKIRCDLDTRTVQEPKARKHPPLEAVAIRLAKAVIENTSVCVCVCVCEREREK